MSIPLPEPHSVYLQANLIGSPHLEDVVQKEKILGTRFNQGLKVVGKGHGPKSGACWRRQLRAALNSGHALIRGRHQILVRPSSKGLTMRNDLHMHGEKLRALGKCGRDDLPCLEGFS